MVITTNDRKPPQRSRRVWAWFAFIGVLTLEMAGCASNGRFVSGWNDLRLRPGDTATCDSNPCRVFFEMPPRAEQGSGTYRLRGTAYTIGDYPAGETAMIGSFFESSVIRVEGADVPPAFIYVPTSVAAN